MMLPKDAVHNQIDWLRDSTWSRFAACWLSQNWPPSCGHKRVHKSPSKSYGHSSDFLENLRPQHHFYDLQPSKLVYNLEERSAKKFYFGIASAGYKRLEPQSKVACIARIFKVFVSDYFQQRNTKFKD
jgi:hypothetical protein